MALVDPSCFPGLSPAERGRNLFEAFSGMSLGAAVGPDFYFANNGNDSAVGTEAEPLATIARANTLNLGAGDRLLFNGGDTFNDDILALTESGVDGNPILVDGYGTGRAVLSAGVEVTTWTLFDAPNKIWRAVFSAALGRPRQIWVDGVLCRRARGEVPTGITETAGGFDTAASSDPGWLSTWGNQGDIEMIIVNDWTEARFQVASVSGNAITMTQPGHEIHIAFMNHAFPAGNRTPTSYENAYEILEANAERGTFYQKRDTDHIFLICPFPDTDPNDVVVIAGVRETVIDFPDGVAHDITFGAGIEVSHTTELTPFGADGFSQLFGPLGNDDSYANGDEFGNQEGNFLASAVHVVNCNRIKFESGLLVRRVAGNGIHIESTSEDCETKGVIHHEIGSIGLVVGRTTQRMKAEAPIDLIEQNNVYQFCGTVYAGCSTGSFQFYAQRTLREHNLFRYMGYSGTSIGYGWYYVLVQDANDGNRVRWNRIRQVMLKMGDGGGIYSNGNHLDAIYAENWISEVLSPVARPYLGIYCDNGSMNISVLDNVVHNVPSTFLIGTNDARGVVTITDSIFDVGTVHDYGGPSSVPPTVSGTTEVGLPAAAIAGAATGSGLEAGFSAVLAEADEMLNLVHDTFTAANGTAINNRTPSPTSIGGKWKTFRGSSANQTIQSNKLQLDGTGATAQSSVIDAGPCWFPREYKYTITGNISISSLAAGAGFAFLFAIEDTSDITNYHTAFFDLFGVNVYSVINGVLAGPLITNGAAIVTASVTYDFLIEQSGTVFTVTIIGIGSVSWDTAVNVFPGILSTAFAVEGYNAIVTVDDVQIKGFVD